VGVQKFYLTTRTAPFTPTNFRGNWNDTAGSVTRQIDSSKNLGGAIAQVSRAETNVTNPYRVCLYRGVSGPLAAQTFSADTLNALIATSEGSNAADLHWHIHAYITTGDTDTVRGTILSDYEESVGVNEWSFSPSVPLGKALNTGQTTTSVVCSAGDRLVVEIGYTARNAVTTSYTGYLAYGTQNQDILSTLADLTAGTNYQLGAGYVSFATGPNEDLSLVKDRVSQVGTEVAAVGTPLARVSQVGVEAGVVGSPSVRLSQAVAEVLRDASGRSVLLSQIVVEVLYPSSSPPAASGVAVSRSRIVNAGGVGGQVRASVVNSGGV
jgi:hypothetical protein